jgi:TonB-linked SusC/RagA family outer membrane protein
MAPHRFGLKGLPGPIIKLLSIGVVLAFLPRIASGQGTAAAVGTLTGQVLDRDGQRPLPSVTVHVQGTGIGTLTNAAGRYVLPNVPARQVVISVQSIGYRQEVRTIQMAAGGRAVANFTLSPQAVALDEIVVTGTAGGTQRRALGNDVSRVTATAAVEKIAPANAQALLSGRASGVQVQLSAGEVGGGNQIKIRGLSSVTLGNGPLLYVDGVRVNNMQGGSSASRDSRSASRMNDFNPEDIESIEIIKGPAAATLYGTEASAGVIQIITKRGVAGAPTFEAEVKAGYNTLQNAEDKIDWNYFINPATGVLEEWHAVVTERENGYPEWLQFGPIQSALLSVRGGEDRLRYYLSGNHAYQEGYVDWNTFGESSFRGNLDATLTTNLSVAVSTAFMHSNRRSATSPSPYTLAGSWPFGHPLRTQTRGWYAATPEQEREIENRSVVDRYTLSVQLNHSPFSWFKHRLIFGQDLTNELNDLMFNALPEGDAARNIFGALALGDKRREDRRITYRSADYSGTARFNVKPELVGATSAGLQYYQTNTDTDELRGQNFAAPGLTALAAAAVTSAGGTWVQNASVGVYLQQQVEWKNRVFLTAAVRGDDNSAFGEGYQAAIYPKLSATWVVNEEPFWKVPQVNTFRLRGAWGKAGRQPDVFAASTFYNAIPGPGNQPALVQGALGNPDLGPEVGTEIEGGFDAGLFDDRIQLNFSYYDKTTKNGLITVQSPSSTGFFSNRWDNLGEVTNRGIEFSLNAQLLQRTAAQWDLGFNIATNRNRIEDLGGVVISTDRFNRNIVGYPIGSVWGAYVVSAQWEGDPDPKKGGHPVNAMCRNAEGGIQPCAATGDADILYTGRSGEPTWFGGVNSTVTLMKNLRLFASVEFKGGHISVNTQLGSAHNVMGNTSAINGDPKNGVHPDPVVYFYAFNSNAAFSGSNTRALGQFPAGFARLRDLSATYTLPESISQKFRAKRASLSVGGHNLWFLWEETKSYYTRLPGDLEAGSFGSQNQGTGGTVFFYPASSVTATMRVTF